MAFIVAQLPFLGHALGLAPNHIEHLGAEYDAIAQAIYSGRGFSDPFGEPSGATAWMPPLLPYGLASLYTIAQGDRNLVVFLYYGFQVFVVFIVAGVIARTASRLKLEYCGLAILVAFFVTNFFPLFQVTHDSCFLLLVATTLVLGQDSCDFCRTRDLLLWGLAGGLTALCSPALGVSWAVITLWSITSQFSLKSALQRILLCAGLSIALVSPWMMRNRVVLGQWIPIKSNAGFELWQSQYLDDDGVGDTRTLAQHPWVSNGKLRREYLEQGEVRFIQKKRDIAFEAIGSNPTEYVNRCWKRFVAIFVYYQPRGIMERMPNMLLANRLTHPIPIAAIVVILFTWQNQPRLAKTSVILYATYFMPYLVLGYNPRYAIPMICIQCLLILHAIAYFTDPQRQSGRREASTENFPHRIEESGWGRAKRMVGLHR